MKTSMQLFSILVTTIMLSGCPIIISHEHHSCNMGDTEASDDSSVCKSESQISMGSESQSDSDSDSDSDSEIVKTRAFFPTTNYQTIGEYTEQIVAELLDKSADHNFDLPIAVPPFMSLISEETYSGHLAIELPENIIADLRNQDVYVAEYRLTPPLPENDLPYEDIMESLIDSQNFGYVLKGTIRNNPHGVTVFVKIIQLNSQAVIASASKHLPQYMLSHRANVAP